jgi:CTP:molybdopterin cytidylyltransferase MocA
MPPQMQPAVIVLAAGNGSRFQGADPQAGAALGGHRRCSAPRLTNALASHLPVVVVTTRRFAERRPQQHRRP